MPVIVRKSPTDGKYYACGNRALLFGSTANVIRYNIFARIITSVANKIFGIPIVSFFDDFGCLVMPELLGGALAAFRKFCQILNISTQEEKTESGPITPFLGLLGEFHSGKNEGRLAVRLTGDKANSWLNLVLEVLDKDRISHQRLEWVLGKLSFPQSAIFGEFARSQTRALYRELYRKIYASQLPARERAVLV